IVFRLIERMGGGMSDEDAKSLYAGVVTDTGRFQYEATTPETLRVGAALRERDFDHARLAQALYEDGSFAALGVMGKALERAQLDRDLRLVWTWITRKDLEEAGVQIQETDDMIDAIRVAREADVAVVLKEQRDGGFKVSLRSRGDTNVGAVAEAFGGGGHRLAAGYSWEGGLDEAVQALRKTLREAAT
ncbi:MAG TPA: DHHA1 domain-containing protein, partial [Actinomycetota bacterium]